MKIIEITPLSNGAHRNQTGGNIQIPEGWAVVSCETPNFPFGTPTVNEIDGVPTVTAWEAGVIPDPEPLPDPEPTVQEDTDAMLVDHELRLTMLELDIADV